MERVIEVELRVELNVKSSIKSKFKCNFFIVQSTVLFLEIPAPVLKSSANLPSISMPPFKQNIVTWDLIVQDYRRIPQSSLNAS